MVIGNYDQHILHLNQSPPRYEVADHIRVRVRVGDEDEGLGSGIFAFVVYSNL